MNIVELQDIYTRHPHIENIIKWLEGASKTIHLQGLSASATAVFFCALIKKIRSTALFILPDDDNAGYFYHDLTQIMGQDDVLFFPSSYRHSTKNTRYDCNKEILRTEVLAKLSAIDETTKRTFCIVTYPQAISEGVVTKHSFDNQTIRLTINQQINFAELVRKMRELGFCETEYVYEPGQFAVRGCIIDVFSFSCEYPFRIDFFGDEIDSIRTFDIENQLSRERCDRADIVPRMEDKGIEKVSLLSLLPKNAIVMTHNGAYIYEAIEENYDENCPKTCFDFKQSIAPFHVIETGHRPLMKCFETLTFSTTPQPLAHKNFNFLADTFTKYRNKGYTIYVLADNRKQNERLKEILLSLNGKEFAFKGEPFIPISRTIHEGFIDNDLKLCLFTDHQIFDRFHKYSLRSDHIRDTKMALTLKEIRQLEPGDYVVHMDHGIGKFAGLVRMPQGDKWQEMIKILYLHGDAIYVSIHSLYKVAKYKAQSNGQAPKLSQLGTGQWERLKDRTKKKIKDIARDLIKLYSTRTHHTGFAFSADTFMQHELEASFLYEDTPDQLKATNDVKADMERNRPMDRLVCGDVGFGKTEVAIRAAFKAVCDSKQVAVLVPTTVLAYQHFQTFSNRLKDFPVHIEYLTRAKTAHQTKQIVEDLATGKIDIIIGTHKLIGKNIKFKDLGLLIVDEEQKFGVAVKEKLRQMKANVDTLTMSATPIPRTLQFSLLGARDMSIIQTPPPNRYPIKTEIHTFDHEIIASAITFEISRNGQVFFVNNRVNDLQRIASLVKQYVPEARIAIGHGQMNPEELEKTVIDFANYDYDVLVSTTIMENGIDIPNANTIIINGAHNFGLSDLHQMRGRVGRGNKKAFCYLLAPPLSSLPHESRRRLEALETFAELGSGITIAMQDLDIRGAGNLLGAEQSGFISELGYETYQKILNQAVTELKNDEFAELYDKKNEQIHISDTNFVDDCVIESDIEMYFPDTFVPKDSERILLYRELDNFKEDDEVEHFRERIKDRFGDIPDIAEELIRIVPLRRLGASLGCEKIILKQNRMILYFIKNYDSPFYRSTAFDSIINFITKHPHKGRLNEQNGKRSATFNNISTVKTAVVLLSEIAQKAK